MQLPSEYRPFSQPTIIVVSDNVQAKLFRANDRDVELLKVISTKTDNLPGERVEIDTSSGDVRSGEPEDDRQDWSREHLYDALSKELMHRLQNDEFEALAFCYPHENENELKESLHVDLLKRAVAWVPKHLTGDELADIVAHVQEEM